MLEALIPYIEAPEKTLIDNVPLIGPVKLQVFGPLVATGVILGWFQGLKYARAKGMDEWFVRDYMWWQIVIAFAFGHWVSVLFYFPDQVAENPWVLLAFWNGLSSVGGFIGGTLAIFWFLRRHREPLLVYGDLSVYGLLVGWCFGRLGCSLVHDHPGRIVDETFMLAVGPWPDGTWRYDLGLYEWCFTVVMAGYVHLIANVHEWKPGRLSGLVIMAYTPFRFVLDFLRADEVARGVTSSPDLRYGGLTTAQYVTMVFFLLGAYLVFFRKPKDSDFRWRTAEDAKREEEAARAKAGGDGDAPASDPDVGVEPREAPPSETPTVQAPPVDAPPSEVPTVAAPPVKLDED